MKGPRRREEILTKLRHVIAEGTGREADTDAARAEVLAEMAMDALAIHMSTFEAWALGWLAAVTDIRGNDMAYCALGDDWRPERIFYGVAQLEREYLAAGADAITERGFDMLADVLIAEGYGTGEAERLQEIDRCHRHLVDLKEAFLQVGKAAQNLPTLIEIAGERALEEHRSACRRRREKRAEEVT